MFGEMASQRRCPRLLASAAPAAALALACAPLAGCGGSGSGQPQYVAAADAICSTQLAQLNRLPQPTTPTEAVSYLPEAITIMRRETAELATVRPDAAHRAQLADALAGARALAATLARLLHQLRSGTILELSSFVQVQSQSEALRAQIDAHFRRADLARCVE
jgi:hypothetical protein